MRIGDGSSDVCFSDLIYLFTGDHLAESDGPRSLGATTYYNRLAQRLTGAMSVPTAAGKLYDVDTRLRPQGAQGPLVVTLDSFERYQREERSEEHTSELQSLMRISYAVFCLKKKKYNKKNNYQKINKNNPQHSTTPQ